ncbi:MAG: transcriptional repressor [Candidatus Omnitrophica bacterium]|nr:transcriptional repressor [Candidatus Omnitrophota bacterium]MCF7877298.1 transcriptional repressor [Candidatus Omnitrophota bacterium]MCF7878570.1 transcriptional repressor [Candidatus Omnitrophota bacterium]
MPRERGWWKRRLRGRGCRLTVPRQAILELLNKSSEHLSAEDIYFKVKKTYPAIGLTTVYRTLELLVNMGVVSKFDFGDGRARYELAANAEDEENHHHHLICTNCGKVINYTDFVNQEKELIEKTENKLATKYNFEINNHQIQFYGICPGCKKER